MKTLLHYFSPYFLSYKFQFFLLFLGVIGTTIGSVGSAAVIKPILDDIFIAKSEDMLYIVPFYLVGIYIIKGAGRYVQAYYTNYIGQDIVKRLRNRLLKHMLHLDMAFFNSAKSGDLISRISNDILRIQNVVASMIPELLRDALTILGLMGYAIYLNPLLAFYSLVVLPATLYPLSRLAKKMKGISHLSQEKNADVTTRLTENFNNIEMIKANSTETEEVARFAKENQHFFDINMRGVRFSEIVSPMMEVFGAFGIAFVIIAGGHSVINNQMSVGSFFAFLTAVGMLYDPIKQMAALLNRMQDGVAATERVFSIIDQNPTIPNGTQTSLAAIQSIQFKDVSLSYEKKQALHAINFEAKRGDTIALVGDSGGGKSSLVNLILRFYETTQGDIILNGTQSIKDIELKTLRSHIAMVSQRVYIFADTLAANIAYGCEIDNLKVIEALKKADAMEFVNQLPHDIHTVMEEFGANLSGGQRQRIAIARAIYKDADILILDEATSALDNKSEKRIQEALESITKDKITFIIAHRLSTIEHASNILVFKSGEIVAQGTHEELLHTSKEYQRLRGTLN